MSNSKSQVASDEKIIASLLQFGTIREAAVDTVAEIMQDKEANPATRLQAAQTLLNNASKFASRLAGDEWQQTQTSNFYE